MALINPGTQSKSVFTQSVGVNLTSVSVNKSSSENDVNFTLTEITPPNWPFGGILNQPGVQTTSSLSRGVVENTAINLANVNLSHVCDFKFAFQFGINLNGLTNPAAAILNAIKNGKNRAANVIRAAMTAVVNEFRTVIKALLAILGLDPSGVVSLSVTIGKDIIRQINAKIKQIAQYIEDIAMVYSLINNIQQIINWIKSLPAKIQTLLKNCLTNFQNSIKQVTQSIQAIPGQITGTLKQSTDSLTKGLTDSLKVLQDSAKTQQGNIDPSLLPILNGSTENKDLEKIKKYIGDGIDAAKETISGNTGDSKASSSGP